MQLLIYSPTLSLATSHLKPAAYALRFGQINVESHSTLQMSSPRICLLAPLRTTSFKGSPSKFLWYFSKCGCWAQMPPNGSHQRGRYSEKSQKQQTYLVIHNILKDSWRL